MVVKTHTQRPVWWWLATWFGVGLLPISGTMGSLAAIPFAYVIDRYYGSSALVAASLLLFLIGWWASEQFVRKGGKGEDPKDVVIDEVAAQWLLLAALPLTWQGYAAGFILFRILDILKPWPVSYADRKIPGGLGVMLDDLIAALYPIVLYLALRPLGAEWLDDVTRWLGHV